ncbi:MAG: DHA2 family efflux MFS transporter permease subunit [Gammaproteobacteria bacterium]
MSKPIAGSHLVLLTISLSLGIFMNVLDTSIANVSIPNIAGDLGVSANQGTWVITSFAISTAIVLPITGWLAKRFGEVRLFLISTFLFTITSLLCGLSENLSMLVAFRVLQGAVAGPMIPLSQSILLANYPEDKKGLATALWAMTAVVAPVFGPILGGWITDNYSWPWIFYINLPVGLFSCVVTGILLSGQETPISKPPIDIVGLSFLIIGIGSLQILLDNGKDLDWFNSNIITILGIISFISLCFLVAWELTEKHPIIDLTLFKRRNFAIGTIALSLGYLVFFANIVIFPLWLQTQMGYTPTWAGLAAAPIGILSIVLSPVVGNNLNRIDLRVITSIGFIVFAGVSFWNSSFNTDVGFEELVIPRLIQGIGIACFFTPLISIVISGLPPDRIASALGLANFFRIIGGSFGTSLSVTIWDRREAFHHSHLVEPINNFNPISNQAVEKLNALGFTDMKSYEQLTRVVTNQAYMLSTNDFFWLSGVIFASLLVIVWFTKPPFLTSGKPLAAE